MKKVDDDQVLRAADRLEELSVVIEQIINDLRTQRPLSGEYYNRRAAYTRVYWLRRELSRVVSLLGADRPEQLNKVDDEYQTFLLYGHY